MASLRLVAHGLTPALRQAVFGADDGLDEGGHAAALGLAGVPGQRHPLGRPDVCYASPALAAVQTARATGHEPIVEPALADCDYGNWHGRTLTDVSAEQPGDLRTWLADLHSAPHGGQSLAALVVRVGGWLDGQARGDHRIVSFTHPAVIRAALVHALKTPPEAFWQFDIAPLSVTHLKARNGRWSLHLPSWR